jgi:hypothetical protein
MKKLWGAFPAVCGVTVWLVGLNITLQGGNTTEEFPLPLHFLALLLFLVLAESPEKYFHGFILGLAFSISFLFRANNAMIETAVVIALFLVWVGRRQFRNILVQLTAMAVGVFLPILGVAYYFWSRDIFKEMFDASITYNVLYTEAKLSSTPGIIAGLETLGLITWMGLIGFVAVLFLLVKHWRNSTHPPAILFLLLVGCPLAVIVTDPAQRNYAHYFINWLPLIALLCGLSIFVFQNGLSSKENKAAFSDTALLVISLLVVLVVFISSGLAEKNWKAFQNVITRSEIERDSTVAIYIQNNTRPHEYVLVWGGFPGENFMAHRASPSAYVTYPLLLDADLSEGISNQFLVDLAANRPVLIVDMDYAKALSLDPQKRAEQLAADQEWPYLPANIFDVLKFIDNNYHVETMFRNATAYRLNGTYAP